ncbi:glutamate--cysteine ligase, partial [Escherichia coli]|nr:glutamate--cysteine ligase [Escherichia coli]
MCDHYSYAYKTGLDKGEVRCAPEGSQALAWLEKHPQALKGIQRGLERETLRVNADGTLATPGHPEALGSALTHKWITTDFAEALLEFITPVDGDIEHMLTFMRDLHRYTARNMGDERMWPLSMPCYIAEGQDIELAQYGTSNTGRFKPLNLEGRTNANGARLPPLSGVHNNFLLPSHFRKRSGGISRGLRRKEKFLGV